MKPAVGVIPANPEIAPFIAALTVGFPVLFQLNSIQTSAQVQAPICVASRALAASAPDARALPALKPNHPSHRRVAPIAASGRLWGTIISGPNPFRQPKTKADARAAIPALV